MKFREKMLKNVKSLSPNSTGIEEIDWFKREEPSNRDANLQVLFNKMLNEEEYLSAWEIIKQNYDLKKIINSPGIMKFLQRCINGIF